MNTLGMAASPGDVRPRQPRILLISEFLPDDSGLRVFGAFQRLKRHVISLASLGPIDVVFFLPGVSQSPPEEISRYADSVRRVWPVEGRIRFIDIKADEVRRRHLRRARDFFWMLRGAISCFGAKPSMRTSGRQQAREMRRLIEELKPDLIFAHGVGSAAPLWRSRAALPPVVIDFNNLDHVRIARLVETETGVIRRLRRLWAIAITRRAEKLATQRATRVLVCSEVDRDKLKALAPGGRIEVVPQSAAVLGEMPPATTPTVLFVGIMGYPPNHEGSLWFAAEVWPRVRARIPNARFVIIGEGSDTLEIQDKEAQGIQTLGFVSDLAPHYREARLVVCPIWRGGGTRIKIVEAAMQSRAIVSTSIGAEGLLFQPKTEILFADDAFEFAEACVSLLQDADRAEAIGRAAQARAMMLYSPSQIIKQTSDLCREMLAARTPRQ